MEQSPSYKRLSTSELFFLAYTHQIQEINAAAFLRIFWLLWTPHFDIWKTQRAGVLFRSQQLCIYSRKNTERFILTEFTESEEMWLEHNPQVVEDFLLCLLVQDLELKR